MTVAAMKDRLDSAEVIEFEPPRPLRRGLREGEPYPLAALGDVVAAAVQGTHALIRAPLEICAQSALSHAALAVQAHANVVLPTGQARPLSLFLLSVAGTGDRKSSADRELGWALERYERNLADVLTATKADYLNQKEAFDASRAAAKSRSGKEVCRSAIADALSSLGEAPAAPLEAVVSFPEPTLEGLHKYLAIGQPSMGLFSDEGGMFVGGVGMSKENALKTAAGFSHLWDGAPVKRLRSLDGATVLFGRRVSLHLMLQPKAAAQWLADETLRDQGLFSRLLVAAPVSLAGTRLYKEPGPEARASIDRFGSLVLRAFERPYPLVDGKVGELEPRPLPMTTEARAMWRDFADSIEGELGVSGKLRPVTGLANKIPEHAARIAAVLALFDNLDVPELDKFALSRGIKLATWYLGEALRLAEVGHVSDEVRLGEALLTWLQESWPLKTDDGGRLVSPPDVYSSGPHSIREKAVAQKALGVLSDHGWLVKLEGAHRVNGVMRREVYAMRST
jgi:hypothetical protein